MHSEHRNQVFLFNNNFMVIEHKTMAIKVIKTVFHTLITCNQNLIDH